MLAPLVALLLSPAPATPSDDAAFFREQVAPILEASCLECHGGGERLRGGLWLTRRERVLEGGESGPAVDLERPDGSLLLAKVSYKDELHRMPPQGKLPDEQLAVLAEWVERGLPWAEDVAFEEHAQREPERLTKNDGQVGWAYLRPVRPEVPQVRDTDWARQPLDQFLLAALEAKDLRPAPEAPRAAWLRRVTFNLIGLPPTPEERAAFQADTEPGAHERVIERLLASLHYGERQARRWLDVVRYAETNGFERDSDKPEIWRYRDWVVRAFNQDLPYDQFLRMQLAGDELDEVTHDSLIATGYLRLMQWDDEPPQGALQGRYDTLDDIVRTTSEGMLATTLGCARCHDHKGDAIDQTDYYSFMSFFEGLTNYRTPGWLVPLQTEEEKAEHERALARHATEVEAKDAERLALEDEFRRAFAAAGEGARSSLLSNLRYRFYRDDFRKLPNFEDLRHEDEGELSGGLFDLSPATREDNWAFVFEGDLRIPEAGPWDVVMDSDDGSRLVIDGREILKYDRTGALGDPQRTTVELEAGTFPVRLEFFEWVGGAALELSMAPAAANRWRATESDPGGDWMQPGFDDSAWTETPGGFGAPGTPASEVGYEWRSQDIWLRHPFQWDPTSDQDPVFVGHHDDHMQVYVNGVLALETTGYITAYRTWELSEEAKAALVPGDNLLAIRCTQDWGGQYVHGRVVPRAETLAGDLRDVAFGRYQLSASRRPDGGDLRQRIQVAGAQVLSKEAAERHKRLTERVNHLRRHPPKPARMANVATETGPHPPLMRLHVRGSAGAQGDEVPIAFPACMDPPEAVIPEPPPGAKTSGRRRVLADWIASEHNPLTARVMVNRLWQQHFGVGLVPTANDFGELGERPSHPELLDWLAHEFMASGWSVKAMHRRILSSAAYRQASDPSPAALETDPTNVLLASFRPRRLTAEELRDSILWLTGQLDTRLGGPPIYSMMPEQAMHTASRPGASWGRSSEQDLRRRSIYIKVKRSLLTPLLTAFDLADTDSTCPQRFTTTSPSQALGLLNGEFSQLRAGEFAQRVAREAPAGREAQVRLALRLALGREPEPADVDDALALWAELRERHGLSEDQARHQTCLYVVNLNEFVYLD